jgi:CPA2 family monovalent cation:H+ antiporter-2
MEPVRGHVIVAGFGRSGRAAAQVLRRAEIPFVVVEINHAVFRSVAEHGFSGIWGDIAGEEILRSAQVEAARILLLTVQDPSTLRLSAECARRLNPSIVTIARAIRSEDVVELHEFGIDAVVQPEFEGGIEMVRQAVVRYGGEDSLRLVSDVRNEFYTRAQ